MTGNPYYDIVIGGAAICAAICAAIVLFRLIRSI